MRECPEFIGIQRNLRLLQTRLRRQLFSRPAAGDCDRDSRLTEIMKSYIDCYDTYAGRLGHETYSMQDSTESFNGPLGWLQTLTPWRWRRRTALTKQARYVARRSGYAPDEVLSIPAQRPHVSTRYILRPMQCIDTVQFHRGVAARMLAQAWSTCLSPVWENDVEEFT